MRTINNLTNPLDAGHEVEVLFFDFSKALTKCLTNCLLHNLHHYGINGQMDFKLINYT